MKRIILAIMLANLLSNHAYAQPPSIFNEKVDSCNFEGPTAYRRHSMTHDQDGNIVFLAAHETTSWDFGIVKLLPDGTFSNAVHVNTPPNGILAGYLFPVAIRCTYDNGFLVIGSYGAEIPDTYPNFNHNYYPQLTTIFYAKFDNNLNLLSFKVHYGYPFTDMSLTDPYLVPIDLSEENDFNGDGQKDYVVLANALDLGSTLNKVVLIRLDQNGDPILERNTDVAAATGGNGFEGATIEYLRRNNIFGITGYSMSIPGYTGSMYPAIVTIDGNLNYTNPLTLVHLPGYLEDCYGYDYRAGVTNLAESPAGKNNLFWGFCISQSGTVSPPSCSYPYSSITPHSAYVVKHDLNLNIVDNKEYQASCAIAHYPIQIKSNATDFSLGLTERFAVGPNSNTVNMDVDQNVKPALLQLSYSNLAPVTYNRYNFSDYTTYASGGLNIIDYNFFQSFDKYTDGTGHEWNTLQVSSYPSQFMYTYTRVIQTDNVGYAPCSSEDVISSRALTPQAIKFNLGGPIDNEVEAIEVFPTTNEVGFEIDPCYSPKMPTSASSLKDQKLRVYPNPTHGNIIIIEGKMQKGTEIELTDVLGHIVHSQKASGSDKTVLNLANISNGMYVLKISNAGKLLKTEKILLN